MPKISISRSLYILLTLIALAFLLASCEGDIPIIGDKTVPIFQGMEIEHLPDQTLGLKASLLSDEEDPFQEAIEENIGVIPSDNVEFFAEPNEDILVTVKLFNPDNFVILRFTLNDVVYQSYQFEQGSDSENLVMKVNAGALTGIREFTLDEIKYIDDTANNAIKDVIIDGDPTLKLGVTYQNLPNAYVVNQSVTAFSLVLSLNVIDLDQLINIAESRLNIFIFDGSSIIFKTPVNIGSSLVRVENLQPGMTYQYAIAGTYDLLDGFGNRTGILWQDTFTTSHLFDLQNISTTQSNIDAELINLTGEQGWIEKVELFDGETLLNTYTSLMNLQIPELLSNHEYTLKLTYGYTQNDSDFFVEITEVITTQEKSVPQVQILNPTSTQESISFGLSITDVDQVGSLTSIELYQGETLITSLTDLNIRAFENLLSDNTHRLMVTYTYDLNDGTGSHEIIITADVVTQAKEVPTISIIDVIPTQESISFGLSITDVDQVGSLTSIELYQGGTLITSLTDLNIRAFENLLSNNLYSIQVNYCYNNNEGLGEQCIVKSYEQKTTEKSSPSIQIEYIATTQSSITFDFNIQDVDGVGSITKIELLTNGEIFASLSDLNARAFDDLLSNTTYELKVTYTYDLNDGLGINELTIKNNGATYLNGVYQMNTRAYDDSTYVIQTENKIYAIYTGRDIDWDKAVLLSTQKGGHLMTINEEEELTIAQQLINQTSNYNTWYGGYFENGSWHWITGEEFTFKQSHFYYPSTVDPSEGNVLKSWFDSSRYWYINKQVSGLIAYIVEVDFGGERQDFTLQTQAKEIPTVSIIDVIPTQESISFGLSITDVDQVGSLSSIELYQGETLIESLTDLNLRVFEGLLSNNTYTIRVTYRYDLNDGTGIHEIVITTDVLTLNKEVPMVSIIDVISTQESIGFGLSITDVDQVGSLSSIELYQGETLIESLTDLNLRAFEGLLSNNAYTIKVTYGFDLNDGKDEQTQTASLSISTFEKQLPTLLSIDTFAQKNSILYSVDLQDIDEVGFLSKIEVFYNGELMNVVENLNNMIFENLDSHTSYQIKYTYSYDLNDGQGLKTLENITDIYTTYHNGLGTEDLPYEITNSEELIAIRYLSDQHFVLLNDIDMSQHLWDPITLFSGVLDGNGYSIHHLRYQQNATSTQNIAFINELTGTVRHVNFMDVEVSVNNLYRNNIGLISIRNKGQIADIHITGNITVRSVSSQYISPISVYSEQGVFTNILSEVNISVETSSSILIGGIVAEGMGTIEYAIYKGTVTAKTGSAYIGFGGIVGRSGGFVISNVEVDVDFDGFSTSENNVGGILGFTDGSLSLDKAIAQGSLIARGAVYTYTGGLIGIIHSNQEHLKIIKNSLALMDIYHLGYSYAGHIYGNISGGNVLFQDVFRSSEVSFINKYNEESTVNEPPRDLNSTMLSWVDQTQLYQSSFYIDTLEFDAMLWHTKHVSSGQKMLPTMLDPVLSINYTSDQEGMIIHLTATDDALLSQLQLIELYLDGILISVQENSSIIEIQGLLSNQHYELHVSYLDANGIQKKIFTDLETKSKMSPTIALIDIVSNQESISFELSITDVDQVGSLTSIELYQGETLIEAMTDLSLRTFEGLLSDNTYTIKVTYSYDLNDGIGIKSMIIDTYLPVSATNLDLILSTSSNYVYDQGNYYILVIKDKTFDQARVEAANNFGQLVSVTDQRIQDILQQLVQPLNHSVWIGGYRDDFDQWTWVSEAPFNYGNWGPGEPSFTWEDAIEIHSNGLWNDIGSHTTLKGYIYVIESTNKINTIAKEVPTVSIVDVISTQESIGFGLSITDVDQVGSLSSIELYQGETLIESLTDLNLRVFEGLLSNNTYTIRVTYRYDLNDGTGIHEIVITTDVLTLNKEVPMVSIIDVISTQESIGFGLSITDVNQVGSLTSIELYKGEELVESLSSSSIKVFSGLLSDNEYSIKVTYQYDLNDGTGQKVLTHSYITQTLPKHTPNLDIEDVSIAQNNISFNVYVNDPDDTGTIHAIELYQNMDLVQSIVDLSSYQFTGIFEGNGYHIKITYVYDLSDGNKSHYMSKYFGFDMAIDMVNVGDFGMDYEVPMNTNNESVVQTVGGYLIATTATTYDLWYKVRIWAENNGYHFQNLGQEGYNGISGATPTSQKLHPVIGVSWRDAIVWLNAFSEMNGLEPVYRTIEGIIIRSSLNENGNVVDAAVINKTNGYRLPTQYEWEMSAKWIDGTIWNSGYNPSGSSELSSNIDESMKFAWFHSSSGGDTHEVGLLLPNQLGLFDMSGNAWEWTDGKYGLNRIAYGGHFNNDWLYLQTGFNLNYATSTSSMDWVIGFRIVRNIY